MNELPVWYPTPRWIWHWWTGGYKAGREDGFSRRESIGRGFLALNTAFIIATGQAGRRG